MVSEMLRSDIFVGPNDKFVVIVVLNVIESAPEGRDTALEVV